MLCREALWKRIQSDFPFACLWFCLMAVWACDPITAAADKTPSIADGELRACQIVTVDSAWAVGDRGLILTTSDAGKHWEQQYPRSDAIHYGVCFSDELTGYVVGGTIDPYSHRSSGVVLTTMDGGKTWEKMQNELPRLTGMQLIEPGHVLAWGDWSDHYQSALFESMDGGQTFSARPIPCGHIQSAAVSLDGVLVLVDRAGKIHRSENGLEFETVNLPTTPFEPLRFCKVVDGVWWLGGEAGKLFRSHNARVWEQLELPGTAEDRSLYTLADIAGHGKRIWVVGQPGNVIWSSSDSGQSWDVLATNNRATMNSVSVLNGELLLTCGTMANLFASRNGGKAWWSQHQSGTRNSVLNISSTHSGVAWDLMAHVVHDSKRHASAIVLHDQSFEERTGQLPELASRFEIAGKSIGLAQTRVMASMPVSNLYSGIRQNDLGYYPGQINANKPESISLVESTPLIKRLVFELRNARPDVVVSNCTVTGTALEIRTALAVEKAVALSSRRDYKVFTPASRIPEEAWEPQRTVVRGTNAGVYYAPSSVLLDSNEVLGSVLSRVKPLMESRGSIPAQDKRTMYKNSGARSGPTWTSPLEGLILDQATQLSERQKSIQRLPMVSATSAWFGWKQLVELDSGNPLTPDRVWDSKIKAAAKEVAPTSISPVLLDIAISCRRSGDWNRWQAALEFLLDRDSESPAAEAALWELMVHTGSVEVKRMVESQRQAIEQRQRTQDGLNSTAANLQQASPFAKVPTESTAVQPAAFSNSVRRIPIATDRDLSEFTRLLSKWPDSFANRRSDPRWGWLIASRYREMQLRKESANASVNLGRSYADFWPSLSPYVSGWTQISKIEREILNANTAPPQMVSTQPIIPSTKSVASLPFTNQRPYLDGKADEAFWQTAAKIEIRDPWASPKARPTTIRFARDDKFLYLFSDAPASSVQRSKKEPKRDSIKTDEDQIRLRIDLDRDYASWFELSWSASGNSSDALNDMQHWNPTQWYLATSDEGNSWCTEIAIELEQLIDGGEPAIQKWTNRAWAFNAIRIVPGTATLSQAPSVSDRVAVDDWFHLDLSPTGNN